MTSSPRSLPLPIIGRGLVDRWAATLVAIWPGLRWVLFAVGTAYCVAAAMGLVAYGGSVPGELMMGDGYMFWAPPSDDLYGWQFSPAGEVYQYRYSPAFAFVLEPLRALPWTGFAIVWFALHIAAVLALRVPWIMIWPGVIDDVVRGNSVTFMALAIVAALSGRSWAWCYPVLTKVTPGIGLIWHLVRREWRELLIAGGATIAIIGVGFLVAPQLWTDWLESLTRAPSNYLTVNWMAPLPIRMAVGAVVVALAARTSRAWLVPLGVLIGLPGLWPSSFALVAASVVLLKESRLRRVQEAAAA